MSARHKVADMFWFDAPKALILKNMGQIFKRTFISHSRHLPKKKLSCQFLIHIFGDLCKVLCPFFHIFRSLSSGRKELLWIRNRWLSMTLGGGVEGISFEASVLSLACLISRYCLSLSWSRRIYNICLRLKKVWTDLKYLYFCSIQEQLEM